MAEIGVLKKHIIHGESGSGKSTLSYLLVGFENAEQGTSF